MNLKYSIVKIILEELEYQEYDNPKESFRNPNAIRHVLSSFIYDAIMGGLNDDFDEKHMRKMLEVIFALIDWYKHLTQRWIVFDKPYKFYLADHEAPCGYDFIGTGVNQGEILNVYESKNFEELNNRFKFVSIDRSLLALNPYQVIEENFK